MRRAAIVNMIGNMNGDCPISPGGVVVAGDGLGRMRFLYYCKLRLRRRELLKAVVLSYFRLPTTPGFSCWHDSR
jgi:hypothetical protein